MIPALWLALSCATDDPCAPYFHEPDAHGYCVSVAASGLARADADALCGGAGTWEDDCRSRWVTGRLRELDGPPPPSGLGRRVNDPAVLQSADALLDFCEDDDCRFLVIDRLQHLDLPTQLRRCAAVGRYRGDCATHAVQGAEDHEATSAEVDALWTAIPSLPSHLQLNAAKAAGRGFACSGGTCPPGPLAEACGEGWTAAQEKGCAPRNVGSLGFARPR